MDKQKAKQIGALLQAAVTEVGKMHGMTGQVHGGTFDPSGLFTVKVEFKSDDVDQKFFERFALGYGLTKEDFGAQYTANGRQFTVSGWDYRSSKAPVLLTRDDGKTFKTSPTQLRISLGRKPGPRVYADTAYASRAEQEQADRDEQEARNGRSR